MKTGKIRIWDMKDKLPPHHLVPRIDSGFLDDEDRRIASEIGRDYNGIEVSLITVLKGAVPFAQNIDRELKLLSKKPSRIIYDAFKVSSYGEDDKSNGNPEISTPLSNPLKSIKGKDVILLEDVVDKGYTMYLSALPYILEHEPNSLFIATMLTKNAQRDPIANNLPVKYSGIDIDFFAVRRGLDWKEHYREGSNICEVIIH